MTIPSFTTRPELRGSFGMISSTHWLATQSGMAVLEAGGNAFDAAVAAGFVLQVVEPHLNGLGGDLPVVLWPAARGRAEVVCGQGPVPLAATVEAVTGLGLTEIPGSGLLAACVPGAFGGWLHLLREYGTVPLRDVLRYAIGYAGDGYVMLPRISATIGMVEQLFRDEWPASAATYLAAGVPAPGSVFRNPDLARTYERLLAEAEAAGADRDAQIEAGLRAFYSGFVAEAVDRHCRQELMDSSGAPHAGLLSGDDLARWRARTEAPVLGRFGAWEVAKCGPWSQGPVLLQQLRLLDGLELGSFLSARHIHTVTEAAKLAFADREAWYADPDFADVPLDDLLSDPYTAERRALIGDQASLDLRPGGPGGRSPRLPRLGAGKVAEGHWTGAGAQAVGDTARGDTVHVCVADRFGNFVACTPSGGWLQSSPVIDGLGFCLGTRAQMLNLDPEHPNRVEPGKRPRTTLTPSLALRDGEPVLAFGTPGGDQQDQWQAQFFLAHAAFGLDLQAAIDAPTFHTSHFPSSFAPHEAFPGRVHLEDRVAPEVVDELRSRGHEVRVENGWSLGRLCAVGRDPATGLLMGASNPRGGSGYAAGR